MEMGGLSTCYDAWKKAQYIYVNDIQGLHSLFID